MKKKILLLAIVAFALFFTFTAYAGTWQQEGSNWKYLKDNGSFATTEWVQDNAKWYYFNEQSIMLTNQWINGQCYVGADGAMLTNTVTPDGYAVGADGKWSGQTAVSSATALTVTRSSSAVSSSNAAVVTSSVSYIGNANTMKFHRSGCASVKKMAENNKVPIESRQEAIDRGYVPCKNCNP